MASVPPHRPSDHRVIPRASTADPGPSGARPPPECQRRWHGRRVRYGRQPKRESFLGRWGADVDRNCGLPAKLSPAAGNRPHAAMVSHIAGRVAHRGRCAIAGAGFHGRSWPGVAAAVRVLV